MLQINERVNEGSCYKWLTIGHLLRKSPVHNELLKGKNIQTLSKLRMQAIIEGLVFRSLLSLGWSPGTGNPRYATSLCHCLWSQNWTFSVIAFPLWKSLALHIRQVGQVQYHFWTRLFLRSELTSPLLCFAFLWSVINNFEGLTDYNSLWIQNGKGIL